MLRAPGLRPKYRWLNFGVGLTGCLLGIVLLCALAHPLSVRLGIDETAPLLRQPYGTTWLIVFLLLMAASLYAGCVLVAFGVGLVLRANGGLNGRELREWALLSRYPRRWYRTAGAASPAISSRPPP